MFDTFKKRFSIARQVDLWSWVGKVAPLTALTILCMVVFFEFNSYTDYLIGLIALCFAVVAFTWWWWVIYAVKDLNQLLQRTTDRFEAVIKDIRDLKAEIRKKDKN